AQVATQERIFIAHVPSGTVVDIDLSSDSNFSSAYVAVYTWTGGDTEAPVADDDSENLGTGDTAQIELDVPAGGAAIAFGATGFALSGSNIIEWTGASEDDEFAQDLGGLFVGYSVASFVTESAAPGHEISIERQDTLA